MGDPLTVSVATDQTGAVDDLDQTVSGLDAETTVRLDPALTWLLGPPGERRPLTSLLQYDVQRLLWRELPLHWAAPPAEHHEVAWALGDLFEGAGLSRYAELCRDRRTHEVLAGWHRDPAEGARLADAADERSGVVPPPTSLLAFGPVRGPVEQEVFRAVSALLEDGLTSGALDPALRGFRAAAARRTERYVTTPSSGPGGVVPLRAVWRERSLAWRAGFPGVPDGFWERAMPAVDDTPPVPLRVELSVAPALALLAAVGDGLDLDADGHLPAGTALALDERYGWSQHYALGRPRGEADVQQLLLLDEHLRSQRLLTVRSGRVTVAAEGRKVAADPARLWSALVAPVPRWRDGIEQDALGVLATALLGQERHTPATVVAEASSVLATRWRGGPSPSAVVAQVWAQWYRLGIPLGWWEERRGPVRPTDYGRAACASLHRAVSTRPRS